MSDRPKRPMGRPRGRKYQSYLPQVVCTPELYEAVLALSKEEDTSIAAVIRKVMSERVGLTEKQQK